MRPDLRAEIDLAIQMFLPTSYHPETHRSASYRESIGAIYITLHPGLMTMTEAVIHEFSSAWRPNSPNDSSEPRSAVPRIRPRCCFLYLTLEGINMIRCSYFA